MLNVVDYTRESVHQVADFSIFGLRFARELDRLADRRPATRKTVCDNDPEFTCKELFFRAGQNGIPLHLLQPGNPTRNSSIESFNGRFREHCLDPHWFASLEHARSIIES